MYAQVRYPMMDLCMLVVNNLPLKFNFGHQGDDVVVLFICPINHSTHDVLNELILICAGRPYYGDYTMVDATGNPLCMYPNYTPVPLPQDADSVIGNAIPFQGGIGFIGILEIPKLIEFKPSVDLCYGVADYVKQRNG